MNVAFFLVVFFGGPSRSFVSGGLMSGSCWTYAIELEQNESPARLLAVALNDVEEPWAAATGIPAPVNSAAEPVAAGAPEQDVFVNTFTGSGSPPRGCP